MAMSEGIALCQRPVYRGIWTLQYFSWEGKVSCNHSNSTDLPGDSPWFALRIARNHRSHQWPCKRSCKTRTESLHLWVFASLSRPALSSLVGSYVFAENIRELLHPKWISYDRIERGMTAMTHDCNNIYIYLMIYLYVFLYSSIFCMMPLPPSSSSHEQRRVCSAWSHWPVPEWSTQFESCWIPAAETLSSQKKHTINKINMWGVP